MSISRRRVLGLLLMAGATGCLSPTLPLPPPSKPSVSAPDETGQVRLRGHIPPRAEALALNTRTGVIAGQVTADDGRYDFEMPAREGDELNFKYVRGTDSSSVVIVVVPAE